MPEFDTLISDTLGFFDDLAANNSRDWFATHKPVYEAMVKRPAEALLATVDGWLAGQTGGVLTPKLYRIHRDVRFSKDKTPYNTHLHLQWSDRSTGICHLFGASRDYVCAGVGAMGFDKPALARWRERVAGEAGAGLATRLAALAALAAGGHRLDPPELKRVPAPHAADHPRAELLKRKGLVVWYDFAETERAAPVATLKAAFTRLAPLRAELAAILAE